MSDFVEQNAINTKFEKNQPWIILTENERQIKEKIEKYGIPIDEWKDIKIRRGILTGCNEAFIIKENTRKTILDGCKTKEEREETDKLIRPILNGEDIKQGSYKWAGDYLINTHNGYKKNDGYFIKRINVEKYFSLKKHLDNYYDLLKKRDDQGDTPYNLRSCAYMDDFNKQKKILYSVINEKELKIAIDNEKYVVNASVYSLIFDGDINKLYHLLISPIFKWYIKKISPSLGNKGIKMNKCVIEKFPIPESLSIDDYKLTPEELEIIKNYNS